MRAKEKIQETIHIPPTTKLLRARKDPSKKETYYYTLAHADGCIEDGVIYHYTVVITRRIHTTRVFYTLHDTDGYHSRSHTTKDRINQWLREWNIPVHLYQEDYTWYLQINSDEPVEFFSGITLIEHYGKVKIQ